MRAISSRLTGPAPRPGRSNDASSFAALTGSMKPISSAKIRRSPPFWMRCPTGRGGPAAISTLRPTRAKIPNRPQQRLHATDQLFADHVQPDERGALARARRNPRPGTGCAGKHATTGSGAVKSCSGDQHVDTAGRAGPMRSTKSARAAVPYSRVRRQSSVASCVATVRSCRWTSGNTMSSASVTQASSAGGDRHRLDGERPVGAVCTGRRTRRPAASPPARPRRRRADVDLRLAERVASMPFQRVTRRSSPAGTNRPVPSPVFRHTRWSAVTSSWWPALVWSRRTSLTPLALVATIRVRPWASKTLVPTASSSTSLPIGHQAGRRADEGVVWLARRDLLRRRLRR